MKILLSILTTTTLLTTPILPLSTNNLISLYSSLRGAPFYPNINVNPNVNLEVYKGTNSWWQTLQDEDNKEYIFNYLDYAKDKTTFLKYYKSVTFQFTALSGSSGFGRNQNYNDPVTVNLSTNNSNHTFFTWSQKGKQNQASNKAWVDMTWLNNKLYFNFKVNCWMYQGGNSQWTDTTSKLQVSKITLNSNQNLTTIKNNLKTALNNEITFVSNYSGSLIDQRNIHDPTGKNNDLTSLLNAKISNVLGDEYNNWKQYIQPFAFSDLTRKATTTIKFKNPTTNQQEVWTFETPIKITLSKDYWSNELNERLHILPGKVVNPDDSTKGMVTDDPEQLVPPDTSKNYWGKWRYHTTVGLEFDALEQAEDGTINPEWVEINGVKIDVLDNKFIATLEDNRIKGENKNDYSIVIRHKDSKYDITYTIDIVIETLVPNLKLKWHAWDPEHNPKQKELITPNLENGQPNPKYDKEINPDTGTKTQIIWIKQKSTVPFPLDPLNKNGEVINPEKNPEEYDLGFIAEGSVVGKGVNQTFSSEAIKNVYREGIDEKSFKSFENPDDRQRNQKITSNTATQYWSDSGIWHYTVEMSDKTTAQKYAIIGPEYQNQYPRFLDIVENNQAVKFWTTIHGVHLKNYLATYKNLDSTGIVQLNYEQVAAYWKDYTSDIIAQKIPPNPTPENYQDISGNIDVLKLNEEEVNPIRDAIVDKVKKYIAKFSNKAVLGIDYQIKTPDGKDITVDASGLEPLLNNQSEAQYLNLSVNTLVTSTILIGNATLQVRNSSTYNPETSYDLSKIKFKDYKYDFSEFNAEDLRNWIYKDVENYLISYGYNDIFLNQDYGISANQIPNADPETHENTPGDLSDSILNDFLSSQNEVKTLKLFVYSSSTSDKTTGYSEYKLINDPESEIVPPEPPTPPDPNKPDVNSQHKYLSWLLPIILLPILGLGIFMTWFIIRLRKKIK
ncbi:Mbov_0399 family ICE element protein [Spiroplasma chrysopicola]|uniref:Uncharacterized protein n=1 Tax=Spiroplasma chrysopicola DF-1 TaxID=1276227 RepID=R4U4H7_9MOLU|nr:hypothetical protein [Spiroplasma chrysopicola]AGM25473.1 hypothetical protein SCHRY_v1c09000 [Spiroplasma chrysopicola DF-1]